MCVVCHDTGRVVWAAPGRSQQTAAGFFQKLGTERCKQITAVSVDLHGGWLATIRGYCPNARVCADPFHVIKLAKDALDELRRADWQRLRESDPDRAKWLKGTRFVRSDRLRDGEQTILDQLADTNHDVYLGWLLVDQLHAVYLARTHAEALRLLDEWILAACLSELEPFVRTAITFETHKDAITNAISLGITNARLEGMNSTVRLLSHRSRGFRRLDSLLALITLVCGRIPVQLPT